MTVLLNDHELLTLASAFTLVERDEDGIVPSTVTVERRRQPDETVRWAVVRDGRAALNRRTGRWQDEEPRARDDEFLPDTRFDSLVDALNAAKAEADLMVEHGGDGYDALAAAR